MPEQRLYSLLSGSTAIADVCGTRIYPVRPPQGESFPALCYQLVGTTPSNGSTGPANVAWARFQLTSYAETYISAKSLATVVRDALEAWISSTGSPAISMTLWQGELDTPGEAEPGQNKYIHAIAQDWSVQYTRT